MNTKRWSRVSTQIEKGLLDEAVAELEAELRNSGIAMFQCLVEEDFTEDPATTHEFLRERLAEWREEGDLAAVYIEMNGFDLNTDDWYFDMFGYAKDGGRKDLEWLCEWDRDTAGRVWVLEGMEQSQAFFARYHEEELYDAEEDYEEPYDMALLIVMVKFVRYIGKVVAAGPQPLPVPVYATAHEFDIIGRFPTR